MNRLFFFLTCIFLFIVDGITQSGNVGIGILNPDTKLHIVGNVKIENGNHGDGKILTSDANGLALWKDPVPETSSPIPLQYHGGFIYVHPIDNASEVNWSTAQTTCENLIAYGFDDWILPSRLELNALYKQSYLITGLEETESKKYWSSTEHPSQINYAFTQRLDYGGPDPDLKTDSSDHNCRCIRK